MLGNRIYIRVGDRTRQMFYVGHLHSCNLSSAQPPLVLVMCLCLHTFHLYCFMKIVYAKNMLNICANGCVVSSLSWVENCNWFGLFKICYLNKNSKLHINYMNESCFLWKEKRL